MLIYANEKNNDVYFPERGEIDKAQFILDRSGLVLKTCKIPTASVICKMLRFFSLSFSETATKLKQSTLWWRLKLIMTQF